MSEILDKQIACVEREIRLRRRCYPSWVGQKRLTQEAADDEIAAMEGVLTTLQFMQKYETVIRSAVKLVRDQVKPFVDAGLEIDETQVTLTDIGAPRSPC